MSNDSTESSRHWVITAWYKDHALQVDRLLGTPKAILNANQTLNPWPAKPGYLVTTNIFDSAVFQNRGQISLVSLDRNLKYSKTMSPVNIVVIMAILRATISTEGDITGTIRHWQCQVKERLKLNEEE
jgi:hypothetical protein